MTGAVALQLYTVRQQMESDPEGCLAAVADAGYDAVEFAGFGALSVDRLRAVLDDVGLRAISSHVEYEELDNDLDRVIEDHLRLGCDYVVIQQALSEHFDSPATVRQLAAQCNEWGRRCRSRGLYLGYHGYHDFAKEFLLYNGGTLYDLFVAETEPSEFHIQLDTFWVRHVGERPEDALRRFSGRVEMLHLKDARGGDADGDCPIGEGVIEWPLVLAAAEDTGVRWLIVEQEDAPDDALRDIRTSLENLRTIRSALAEIRD